MLEMSRPKNLLFLRIMIYSLENLLYKKNPYLNKKGRYKYQILILFILLLSIFFVYTIKITMSSQKLPNLGKPLFKNMLQKQQISYRMQIHKQKIDKVSRSKSKFTQEFEHNPNLTYRTLFEQNPKKNKMLETKYMQIERENKLLFERIRKVHKSKNSKKKSESLNSLERMKSMNITIRKKQIEQIQVENVRILSRITRQKPSISFKQTDKQYDRSRRFSQKLSKIEKYRIEDWY